MTFFTVRQTPTSRTLQAPAGAWLRLLDYIPANYRGVPDLIRSHAGGHASSASIRITVDPDIATYLIGIAGRLPD